MQCLPDAIYSLIIGDVTGAGATDDPDPSLEEAYIVTTRSQAKKAGEHSPLKVPSTSESTVAERDKLKQLQSEDDDSGTKTTQ